VCPPPSLAEAETLHADRLPAALPAFTEIDGAPQCPAQRQPERPGTIRLGQQRRGVLAVGGVGGGQIRRQAPARHGMEAGAAIVAAQNAAPGKSSA
jgi:hypothetical protein